MNKDVFARNRERQDAQVVQDSNWAFESNEVDMYELSKDTQFSTAENGDKVFLGEDARQKNGDTELQKTIASWKENLGF